MVRMRFSRRSRGETGPSPVHRPTFSQIPATRERIRGVRVTGGAWGLGIGGLFFRVVHVEANRLNVAERIPPGEACRIQFGISTGNLPRLLAIRPASRLIQGGGRIDDC